jgi:hypothetical protein
VAGGKAHHDGRSPRLWARQWRPDDAMQVRANERLVPRRRRRRSPHVDRLQPTANAALDSLRGRWRRVASRHLRSQEGGGEDWAALLHWTSARKTGRRARTRTTTIESCDYAHRNACGGIGVSVTCVGNARRLISFVTHPRSPHAQPSTNRLTMACGSRAVSAPGSLSAEFAVRSSAHCSTRAAVRLDGVDAGGGAAACAAVGRGTCRRRMCTERAGKGGGGDIDQPPPPTAGRASVVPVPVLLLVVGWPAVPLHCPPLAHRHNLHGRVVPRQPDVTVLQRRQV